MTTRRARHVWTRLLVIAVLLSWGARAGGEGGGAGGGGGGGGAGGGAGGGDAPWRSALYPDAWEPGFADAEGRTLPDVSYAGYRAGEAPLPDLAKVRVVDVVADHGADPTGATDSTAAFQEALDARSPAVVRVPAGLYRCDGLLEVRRSGVVLRGEGAGASRVWFTKADGMTGKAHLAFRGAVARGAEVPLVEDAAAGDLEVRVRDAGGLRAGTRVALGWVVGDGFVAEHGMTGTWKAFHGQWQAFLLRDVVSVRRSSGAWRVRLDAPVRYPAKVRDGAGLRVETGHLEEVGVADLGLANAVAWDAAWASERVHVLALVGARDAWVRGVASFVPPAAPASGHGAGCHLQNGGILVSGSRRVTVADCRMERAEHRGSGGCGYLYEILQSCDVLTRDCVGIAGRHNFVQNWGFGTTGCVWLRCRTAGGLAVPLPALPTVGTVGFSEYHHSLATANLVDSCVVDDGWGAVNRRSWSSGAGHTATRCVFWNLCGEGTVRSQQYGWGYVIGTRGNLRVDTALAAPSASGTAPEDFREGIGDGATVSPSSLYEDQFRRRVGRAPEAGR